jgi:hypothetical protein
MMQMARRPTLFVEGVLENKAILPILGDDLKGNGADPQSLPFAEKIFPGNNGPQ